ncbi:MAG: phage terminase large subunit [Azospirillaceae bacterium]
MTPVASAPAGAAGTEFPVFIHVWNRLQGFATPPHHLRIARWLERSWRSGDRHLLLMAFRSSGKSTLVGLFAAWLLAAAPDLRILVLSADQALARRMVRNTRRLIERHPLTAHLRPDRPDEWAAEQFTVARPRESREPSMLARGLSGNITGSRADIVICDDVEVPNTSDTVTKRADLRERLGEIDYVLVPDGLQLYVGTPHTYYTLYADRARPETGEEAPFLAGFRRLELPLVGDDGRSAWPERFPSRIIERIRKRTGTNKFLAQMQLQPVSVSEGRLDPDRLRAYDAELDRRESGEEVRLTLDGRRMVSAACWWDPAFAPAERGDGSVIAAVFADGDGQRFLHRVRWLNRRGAPAPDEDEATRQCRAVARFLDEHHLPAVAVETNGLGRFLPGLLRQVLRRDGIPAAVIEVTSRRPKDVRILEALDALLAAGALHAHRDVLASPLVTEMRDWRPGGGGSDDGLDAVAGALSMDPVRLRRLPDPPPRPDWRPARPYSAPADFEP